MNTNWRIKGEEEARQIICNMITPPLHVKTISGIIARVKNLLKKDEYNLYLAEHCRDQEKIDYFEGRISVYETLLEL
jgi:hypothetical protein